MPQIRLRPQVSFLDAVRRGMTSVVKQYLEDPHLTYKMSFHCPDTGDKINPFEHALAHQRWACALELFEQRRHSGELLPPGLDDEKAHGPQVMDTPEKRAFSRFLDELDTHRAGRPLPPALIKRMAGMLEAVAEQEGKDAALLRTLLFQPPWLDWPQRLLDKGASVEARAIGHNGATINALSLAAGRGLVKATMALLGRGVNVLYKHHDFSTAAHLAANFSRMDVRVYGAPCLDTIERRMTCLDLLLAHEGAGQMRDLRGRTPLELLEASKAWLSNAQAPHGEEVSQAYVAHWRQRRMDLLLPKAEVRARGPRM